MWQIFEKLDLSCFLIFPLYSSEFPLYIFNEMRPKILHCLRNAMITLCSLGIYVWEKKDTKLESYTFKCMNHSNYTWSACTLYTLQYLFKIKSETVAQIMSLNLSVIDKPVKWWPKLTEQLFFKIFSLNMKLFLFKIKTDNSEKWQLA